METSKTPIKQITAQGDVIFTTNTLQHIISCVEKALNEVGSHILLVESFEITPTKANLRVFTHFRKEYCTRNVYVFRKENDRVSLGSGGYFREFAEFCSYCDLLSS